MSQNIQPLSTGSAVTFTNGHSHDGRPGGSVRLINMIDQSDRGDQERAAASRSTAASASSPAHTAHRNVPPQRDVHKGEKFTTCVKTHTCKDHTSRNYRNGLQKLQSFDPLLSSLNDINRVYAR